MLGVVMLAFCLNFTAAYSTQAEAAASKKTNINKKVRAKTRARRHVRRRIRLKRKKAISTNWADAPKKKLVKKRRRKITRKRRVSSKRKRRVSKTRTRRAVRKKHVRRRIVRKKTVRRKARRKIIVRKPILSAPHRQLSHAIDLAKKGKFDAARTQARQSGLAHSGKLIDWLILQHSNSPAKASDIALFLKTHPGWPHKKRLLARAESAYFFHPLSSQHTIDYFTAQPPQTGIGKAALARAYKRKGDTENAKIWLKRVWHKYTLSQSMEKIILTDMGHLLTTKDHLARVAHFTFAQAPRAIMRLKRLLKKTDRAAAYAQASLLFFSKRAMARVRAVPKALKNSPPLQFALARYWRKKDKYDKTQPHILKAPSRASPMNNPKAWWTERHVTARYLLGKGKMEQAYRLSRPHGVAAGNSFAQAEFFSGWLALVHLKMPQEALEHFTVLRNGVKKPRSIARAEYWCGRAHRALKHEKLALKRFEAAAKYSKTYYGQLALDELGETRSRAIAIDKPKPDPLTKAYFEATDLVQITRMLAKAHRDGLVRDFMFALMNNSSFRAEALAVANLAHELKLPHIGIRIAKKAEERGHDMGTHAYPFGILPKYPQLKSVDMALLYGLIRQESEFNASAKSWAGARGLMQIMPGTARLIARQYKQRYRRDKLTKDPAYNLRLGSAHLQDLINNHRGSYIMALASYNAGPGRTIKWTSVFGDPRGGKMDPIDWVESIPFNETRDYVQKVMENMYIYRSGLTPKGGLSFTQQLERGTPVEKAQGKKAKGKKKHDKQTNKIIKPKVKPPKRKT